MVFVLAPGPVIQVTALGCGLAGSVKTLFTPLTFSHAEC